LFDRGPARRLLLEPKERRDSGENKREFAELLKRDWEAFERRRKAMSAAIIDYCKTEYS
jgi:hypothetical protein